jgi:hypothetical protein
MKFLNLIAILVLFCASLANAQSTVRFDPFGKVTRFANSLRQIGYDFETLPAKMPKTIISPNPDIDAQTMYYQLGLNSREMTLESTTYTSEDDPRNKILAKQGKNQVCILLSNRGAADHFQFACFVNMVKQQ